MSERNHRTVKVKTPWGVIISACLVGLLILGGIIFAVWSSGQRIVDARMRGVVVEKEFVPQAEDQITIGDKGLRTSSRDGEYIVTVDVLQSDGITEPYSVWLDKERFDALKIGDNFDVGPYLVK